MSSSSLIDLDGSTKLGRCTGRRGRFADSCCGDVTLQQYSSPESLDYIAKRFDETTKRLFRDKRDAQFVPFGSPFDKDPQYGIRAGQLKLTG